jgi:hypothetical protein
VLDSKNIGQFANRQDAIPLSVKVQTLFALKE